MRTHHQTIEGSVDIEAATAAATEYFLSTDEFMMIGRYSWTRGVDEETVDLKDADTRRDYESFVAEYASERVSEAYSELCWAIDAEEGRVSAWRSLTVPTDFLENGIFERPLGRYWAYCEDAAEPHWGDFSTGRHEIVLHGVVDIDAIDWQISVVMNAHSEEEKELRLKPHAVVHVVSATWKGDRRTDPGPTIQLGIDLPAGEATEPSLDTAVPSAA